MPNNVVHFAIHADDPERARAFYEQVFGWRFEPWGPPEFWQVFTSDDECRVRGALHRRLEPLDGTGMRAFECTVGVDDVQAIAAAVSGAGGTVLDRPHTIEGVGTLVRFLDTEGNRVNAMQYAKGVMP
ncbi:MAG: VOC family protein [Phycisphaerales bacterium JB040]